MGIKIYFHGHGDKFSWASRFIFMGMEIYNDGQRDFSVAQWDKILTAVGISSWHSEKSFMAQWEFLCGTVGISSYCGGNS